MKLNYNSLEPHERALKYLVDSVTEAPEPNESLGFEKSTTVRFNQTNYSKVKAIANISGNSLSSVVNDLVMVAYASVTDNMSEQEVQRLSDESLLVHKQLVEDLNKGGE